MTLGGKLVRISGPPSLRLTGAVSSTLPQGDHSSFTFERNIVYVEDPPIFYATTNNR
jgi:hypothetical protein